MSLAVAATLGYILGNSLRSLRLAMLASAGGGVLTAPAFALLPYAWNGRALIVELVLASLVLGSVLSGVPALGGMLSGRRRARKGFRA